MIHSHLECPFFSMPTRQLLNSILDLLMSSKRLLLLLALIPVMLLSFGLYLQHGLGLEPCPMCIVQRYVMLTMLLWALLFAFIPSPGAKPWGLGAYTVLSFLGAYVAARQSWLQWYPPEVVSCGRDFYGMIETFPLKRAIPMIFKGGGDCSAVDWTFLGGSIANWSFVAFVMLGLLVLFLLIRITAAIISSTLR